MNILIDIIVMLENIYYFIGGLVVMSLLSIILKFGKLYSIKEWKEKYEKITGKKPTRKEFRTKKEFSLHESAGILGLFELLWIIGGFFTGNWYLFGITLALSYLLTTILKPIRFTLLHKLFSLTFLLSRLCLYLYLIANHFYLHQDTYIIVKHYIKW
jgi:type III secretory pathway component EscU